MSEGDLQLLAAIFGGPDQATRALATLVPALGENAISMAAVIRREQDGAVHWAETHDAGAAEGAVVGFGFGAVVGLLGIMLGPVALLGAPIGAGIGALVAKLRDKGYEDDDLRALGEDLAPGESALVANVSAGEVEKARRLLEELEVRRVVIRGVASDVGAMLDQEAAALLETEVSTPEE
jgi:uncharacterized membrane protein